MKFYYYYCCATFGSNCCCSPSHLTPTCGRRLPVLAAILPPKRQQTNTKHAVEGSHAAFKDEFRRRTFFYLMTAVLCCAVLFFFFNPTFSFQLLTKILHVVPRVSSRRCVFVLIPTIRTSTSTLRPSFTPVQLRPRGFHVLHEPLGRGHRPKGSPASHTIDP